MALEIFCKQIIKKILKNKLVKRGISKQILKINLNESGIKDALKSDKDVFPPKVGL